MLDDLWFGLSHLLADPTGLTIFIAGLLGGMLFGAIPGVNLLTLGAVVLPFTAYMSPTHAIMFYAVIYCTGVYGGAITAILFNIPGSPENAPTAIDGYPMTQQGRAGKAIGAAVTCSAIGGIASVILLMTATSTIADWAVRVFGPPEIFGLILFGICVAASVGATTIWKGWLSVGAGLLIGTVGVDPGAGVPRFDFGTYYLRAGISFIPLILGFFAVAEVFVQSRQMATGTRVAPKVGLAFPTLVEFWRLRIAVLRSTLIGFFAGLLPGVGAVLAAFLSYNEAARWSRNKARFGKGEMEGVVASETANNAATGAAMIPLLALGLPGGALTAMMAGVFQIHGLELGPLIMITQHDLVWIVFAAMLLANVSIFILGYVETKTVVHLLRVPFRYLAPGILLLATIGAYALRNLMIDVWVMYAAGLVGYLMRRSGYSIAGVVLGVILGDLGESAFVKSMQLMDYDPLNFLQRPVAATLIGLSLLMVVVNFVRRPRVASD